MKHVKQHASPYSALPPRAFWSRGVAGPQWDQMPSLYKKKFSVGADCRIATAGSCFAQHVSRYLRQSGYNVIDVEPPPPGLSPNCAREFGYTLYSARYGNIYTVRHLRDLVASALGAGAPPSQVWIRDGRYYDAMRPTVEPRGLQSVEEVSAHREQHLERVRRLIFDMDLLVFTFGLTEAWTDCETGAVFPTCPGVVAGEFDPRKHEFKNFGYQEVLDDFLAVRELVAEARRREGVLQPVRYLLTVSPVPLIATASGDHVLTATMYSKAVLRAVAGHLASTFSDIDYFPSFEIVTAPWSGRAMYGANQRDVTADAVGTVMGYFFREHGNHVRDAASADNVADETVHCDEAIMEALAPANGAAG